MGGGVGSLNGVSLVPWGDHGRSCGVTDGGGLRGARSDGPCAKSPRVKWLEVCMRREYYGGHLPSAPDLEIYA